MNFRESGKMPIDTPTFVWTDSDCKIIPDYLKLTEDICDIHCKLKAAGFSHEESFWIIKSMIERMPR